MELILEVRLVKNDTDFLQKLSVMDGVSYTSLVSYDGNYTP